MGTSRGPIREAIRILAGTGLVTAVINRGVFVRKVSVREMLEVYELRALVFGFAAERAAEHVTDADRARFEALLDGMDAACQIQAAPPHVRVQPLRDRKPQRGRLQPLLGQVQRLLTENFVGKQPLAGERDHLRPHFHVAEVRDRGPPRPLPGDPEDVQVGIRAGLGVVIALGRDDCGHALLQIQPPHQVGLALVKIDRSRVHLLECPCGIDRANQAAALRIDDAESLSRRRAHLDVTRRVARACPVPPAAA
ncbi:MAG TPA: GntR family transcriptional regulator [bacterium]|nr:GntR family transcriptional regulator [bacterium]